MPPGQMPPYAAAVLGIIYYRWGRPARGRLRPRPVFLPEVWHICCIFRSSVRGAPRGPSASVRGPEDQEGHELRFMREDGSFYRKEREMKKHIVLGIVAAGLCLLLS